MGWPAGRYRREARAAALVERLFPEGLLFLTFDHKSQWAEGDKRLKQIETESLGPQVDELAGPAFLAEVATAQNLFGAVLGILAAPAEQPAPILLAEPLAALRRAMRAYVVQVVAQTDEDDGAGVVLGERMLAPIAEARVARTQSAKPAPAPLPSGSVPPTPAAAPASQS